MVHGTRDSWLDLWGREYWREHKKGGIQYKAELSCLATEYYTGSVLGSAGKV